VVSCRVVVVVVFVFTTLSHIKIDTDNNPCTIDVCENNQCKRTAAPAGGQCDDQVSGVWFAFFSRNDISMFFNCCLKQDACTLNDQCTAEGICQGQQQCSGGCNEPHGAVSTSV
jgi:hypothetical protein